MHWIGIYLLALVAIITGCTTSSAIMTGQARAAKPASDVRVYLRPPAKFESIALVSAMSNAAVSRVSAIAVMEPVEDRRIGASL